jgi:hypothetical protein
MSREANAWIAAGIDVDRFWSALEASVARAAAMVGRGDDGNAPGPLELGLDGRRHEFAQVSVGRNGLRSARFCCCSEGGTRTRDTTIMSRVL